MVFFCKVFSHRHTHSSAIQYISVMIILAPNICGRRTPSRPVFGFGSWTTSWKSLKWNYYLFFVLVMCLQGVMARNTNSRGDRHRNTHSAALPSLLSIGTSRNEHQQISTSAAAPHFAAKVAGPESGSHQEQNGPAHRPGSQTVSAQGIHWTHSLYWG